MAEIFGLLGALEVGGAAATGFGLAEAGLAAGTAGIFGGAEAGLGAGLFAGSTFAPAAGAGLGAAAGGLAGGLAAAEGFGGFEGGLGFAGGAESGLAGTSLGFEGLAGAEALGSEFAGLSGFEAADFASGIGQFGGAEGLSGVEAGLGGLEGGAAGNIAATGAAATPSELLGGAFQFGEGAIADVLGPSDFVGASFDEGFGLQSLGPGPGPGVDVAGTNPFSIQQGPAMAGGIADATANFPFNTPLGTDPGSFVATEGFSPGADFSGTFSGISGAPQPGELGFGADPATTGGFSGNALPEGFQVGSVAEGMGPPIQNFEALQSQISNFMNPEQAIASAQQSTGFSLPTAPGAGFGAEIPAMSLEEFPGVAGLDWTPQVNFETGGAFGDVAGLDSGLSTGGADFGLGDLATPSNHFMDQRTLALNDLTQSAGTNALAAAPPPLTPPAADSGAAAAAGAPSAAQAGGSLIPRTIGGIPTGMILPGAMLARSLIQGPDPLSPQARAAEAQARGFSGFSQQQLADAQAGRLNPAQAAAIQMFRQNAQNALYQQLAAQGIDPRTSTQFQAGMQQIEQQAQAMQRQFIDSMFQQAFTAGGQSSNTLLALSQQSMAQDAAFRQAITSALTSIGLAAGGGGVNLRLSAG